MLIAFLLLAVLTIGAVSASDDVASDDDLAVSDDGDEVSVCEDDEPAASEEDDSVSVCEDDELGELTEDDVKIEVKDIRGMSRPDDNFTTVSVSPKEGEFTIYKNSEDKIVLFSENLDETEDGYYDKDGAFVYRVSYSALDSYIANNVGDKFAALQVSSIEGWGPMGPEESIFIDLSGVEVKDMWSDGAITINMGNLEVGTNCLMIRYYLFDSEEEWSDDGETGLVGSDLIKVYVAVDPELTVNVDNITEGEIGYVKISTVENFTGDVLVQVAGGNYTVALTNGSGELPLEGLTKGNYTVLAIFKGVEGYIDSNASANFTVSAKPVVLTDPSLTIKVPNAAKSNGVVVTVTTNTAFSGTVNVQIGSKTYAVSVVKGKGTKTISGLAVGTYTAKATFKATGVFKQATKSVTFKVKADTIKLTVNKVKIKKSAKLVIKATLKINGKKVKGKKITLKFKGKKYKAKTNKKGVAKFTIKKKVLKKLKVGKKITYKVSYGKKTAKKTVKVKK